MAAFVDRCGMRAAAEIGVSRGVEHAGGAGDAAEGHMASSTSSRRDGSLPGGRNARRTEQDLIGAISPQWTI
ncbi:hypothetical protein GCM10022267_85890 [Lentzea roselyniae]|uniref:Transposase n=1 Tax=Lentzea roselyniae TaxID=531940 RepID=A0ABP7CEG9_9PSEU